MDATLTEFSEGPSSERGGELLSLRPPPGRWDAMLAASAAAFDLAMRARLSAEHGASPLTRRQRAGAAGAALAGIGGIGALAAVAALKPDLGPYEPAALLAAVGSAALPVALCIRRATVGIGRRPAASAPPPPDAAQAGPPALLRRLMEHLRGPDRAGRRGRAPPRPHPAAGGPAPAAPAGPPRSRRHERIKPRNTRTLIATQDGRRLNAVVMDVSQSGVAIEGNLPGLWIGSMVTVGSRRAKAVRMLPHGMAFEFSTPVPAEALTVDFVL